MVLAPSYSRLPEKFYERLEPVEFSQHSVLYWNESLAKELGLTDQLFYGPMQVAQAYAGHQFGHFVPQLGDGRARLVGELKDPAGQLFEVHLKGSGPTQFSRRGDGLATLDAVLRELLVSEGMHFLGIPTTRTLAVLGTGERVQREREHPGAIQVRIAKSHVRVGTFEYFAARGDTPAVKLLADEMIDRLFPQLKQKSNAYLSLFETVIEKQIQLVARWLQVGFIHGVMNTDNTTISGETIDYGPCAFMEAYEPLKVYSSIDRQGRYAYARQPQIIKWNLTVLGYCLLPLFDDNREKATQMLESTMGHFEEQFHRVWLEGMAKKLGISDAKADDEKLIQEFLSLLSKHQIDFTLGFRRLGEQSELFSSEEFKPWFEKWKARKGSLSPQEENPIIIPRNHKVEQAIAKASLENDFTKVHRLLKALEKPFTETPEFVDLQKPAEPHEQVSATFCGT